MIGQARSAVLPGVARTNSRFNVTTSKALLLFVVISTLWCVSVSATSISEEDGDTNTTRWISQRPSGRFILQNLFKRRNLRVRNFCGGGRAPNFSCKRFLPWPIHRNPQCCTTRNNDRVCIDVGGNNDARCGSCTRSCRFGFRCCSGVCVNQLTDRYNCGRCGNRCIGRVNCRRGLCGYNGRH